jgi:hypothetical protein
MPTPTPTHSGICYIDFETTAADGDLPALLGVLLPDGQIRQYVVDSDLWPAAVAQKACVSASLADAVADILETVRAGAMCAWSEFDLLVIDSSPEVPERVKKRVRDRYVNGRRFVGRWARTVYGFAPTGDTFHPARAMKKYVAHFACPWPGHLRAPQPARWIRHVRRQLQTKDSRYRAVTAQAKRDWHRLLEYNRADLQGLACLVSRADAELRKHAAYGRTTYRVFAGGRPIAFRTGAHKPALDALLERTGARYWAHLTAWNPGTEMLDESENRERQLRLVGDAARLGCDVLPGEGRSDDGKWPAEESAFVVGISERDAVRLAARYGQWAILAGDRGGPVRLVWCRRPNA